MKLLYISHLHPPRNQPLESVGGMQNVSIQLVEALERRDDVELKTIIQRAPWKGIGLSTTVFLFRLLNLIPRAVKEFKPDVILFSSMVTAGVIPFLPGRITTPMVTINHGQDVTLPFPVYQRYLPVVFNKLSGVISVSRATRQASISRGLNPEKGVALPNGLDSHVNGVECSSKEARERLSHRLDLDLSPDRPLLLTVGRQVRRKGHAWFIREVLPRLESQVDYLIIGDGPEHQLIRQVIDQSAHKDVIHLVGRQPNDVLQLAYCCSDLFVMPNIPVKGDMEGFGIVLLEANQRGLPAIASDLEGIRDVIVQGVNGYRVPHSEPALFARKIDDVLESELEKLSFSAREYVLNHFSWDSVVEQYLKFLEEIAFEKV